MKKCFEKLILMLLCLALLTGCSSMAGLARLGERNTPAVPNEDGEIGARKDGGSGGTWGGLFGGEKTAAAEGGSVSMDADYAVADAPMSAPMEVMPEPMPGIEPPICPPGQEIDPVAGTLTAGSIDDNRAWGDFTDNAGQVWNDLMSTWTLRPTHRIEVSLTASGKPLANIPVTLLAGEEALWRAVTDYEGRAFLFYGLTGDTVRPDAVRVGLAEIGQTVPLEEGQELVELDFQGLPQLPAAPVDVMFVVDTTGSMGDELEYLKAELEDVMARAGQELGSRKLRLSVNFYRDEGDEYVVRYFRFHEDISQAIENLRGQSANGGGDYPEAVDQALDNAVNGHAWEEGAVKLLFLVLDAPAHQSGEIAESLRSSIAKAAELGIRIIPVASSGVDEETEFLTRSAAVLTGGTYTFLTDHSGVGLAHKDPTNVDYQVEPLNQLLLRLITLYAGN